MTNDGFPLIIVSIVVLLVLVVVLLVWKKNKDRKSGYPSGDERTSKLSGKAALGTLWICYVFMISLVVWNAIGIFLDFPKLDSGWTVVLIMAVCSTSFALLRWYYERKGDA